MKTVVITGARGFIGGQTAIKLKNAGYNLIGIDQQAPTSEFVNKYFTKFLVSNFASEESFHVIKNSNPCAIVHCAGTSLVGPSMKDPAPYYENNMINTKKLLDFLVQEKINAQIVFSSSASTYGEPVLNPCQEVDPVNPLSPYGESKLCCEYMLHSYAIAYNLKSTIFRYFNVCGADPLGQHGQMEDASHIIARILEALRDNKKITIFGNKYPTPDGTCIRDYVHVDDIANAHLLAIEKNALGLYNLGTGTGYSNSEILNASLQITDKLDYPISWGESRPGDPAVLTGSSNKFYEITGWQPTYSLNEIIQHAWNWYTRGL